MHNNTLNITDAKLLAQAIENVQANIRVQEMELKSRFSRFPEEGLKSAASMILPTFLTTKLTGATLSAVWSFVRIVTGHKKAIFPLIGSAAKAGILSFIKNRLQNFGKKPEKVFDSPTIY